MKYRKQRQKNQKFYLNLNKSLSVDLIQGVWMVGIDTDLDNITMLVLR